MDDDPRDAPARRRARRADRDKIRRERGGDRAARTGRTDSAEGFEARRPADAPRGRGPSWEEATSDAEDGSRIAGANAAPLGAQAREPSPRRAAPPAQVKDAGRQSARSRLQERSARRGGDGADARRNESLVAVSIGKAYKKRVVVRDVSLRLNRGEIVGLLGPNGAGKTTCFYMITGLVPVDRGRIGLKNEDVTALPMHQRARRGLGYLPQESSIFRGLTVEQNIRAALELTNLPRSKREQRLDELLGEFSIARLRKTPALALSGGERRRVEIARALASDPSFILLDEPFAGVDPIAVGDIRQLVWQLKDRGIGVLITDHNVRETLGIIDRAYILHDGRVLMQGAPDDVVNDENVRRVYLGEGFRY